MTPLRDVRVDHGRLQTLVPQQHLNGTNVGPALDEVGGETVPQRLSTMLIHRRCESATGIIRFSSRKVTSCGDLPTGRRQLRCRVERRPAPRSAGVDARCRRVRCHAHGSTSAHCRFGTLDLCRLLDALPVSAAESTTAAVDSSSKGGLPDAAVETPSAAEQPRLLFVDENQADLWSRLSPEQQDLCRNLLSQLLQQIVSQQHHASEADERSSHE